MNTISLAPPTSRPERAAPAGPAERNSAAPVTAPAKALRLQLGLAALACILIVGAVTVGVRYFTVGRYLESTDDAYVSADSSTIAPKISGYVESVLIEDNQTVKAGQLLARIDDRDLRTARDDAAALVAAAEASVANVTAQLEAQKSEIDEAAADASVAATALSLAERNDTRRQQMALVGYGSIEQSDDATADHREKSALLHRANAALVTARRQIAILGAQRNLALAQLARAEATLHQAELNLSYAGIRAPIDGTVAARSIRVGQYVQAGTPLMELVPLTDTYIIANFKETQLTQLRAGQKASIAVDAFPDDNLPAHVVSIAPASGLEFSLLPPDNATGNFTKIVQRVPVKLAMDRADGRSATLRPGMSVNVSVDTRPGTIQHERPAGHEG